MRDLHSRVESRILVPTSLRQGCFHLPFTLLQYSQDCVCWPDIELVYYIVLYLIIQLRLLLNHFTI